MELVREDSCLLLDARRPGFSSNDFESACEKHRGTQYVFLREPSQPFHLFHPFLVSLSVVPLPVSPCFLPHCSNTQEALLHLFTPTRPIFLGEHNNRLFVGPYNTNYPGWMIACVLVLLERMNAYMLVD